MKNRSGRRGHRPGAGDRLGCAAHRDKGTCANNRTIRLAALETRVLAGLRQRLLAPENIALLLAEYGAERARLHAEDRRGHAELGRRIVQLSERVRRLVNKLADGVASRATREQLLADEAERDRLEAELTQFEGRAGRLVELHPRAIARYQERVAALTDLLRAADPSSSAELAATLRGLVDRIDVTPLPARGQAALTAHGLIAGLVDYASRRERAMNQCAISGVAGEGFEPPTLGL